MKFLHLNNHTNRSANYGLIKVPDLVEESKKRGLDAVAISDYSSLASAVLLKQKCEEEGLKPIYGAVVNIVDDKQKKVRDFAGVQLIAKNYTGFQNLVKILTVSSMYFYYFPRIDWEVIQQYHEGLICLTGDLRGVAATEYFLAREEGLGNFLHKWGSVFGDDLYFEVHPFESEAQQVYNDALCGFAEKEGVRLVATGNCHYLRADDRELHFNVMQLKVQNVEKWVYPFKGSHHFSTYGEMLAAMRELHGNLHPILTASLFMPEEINRKIDSFDIKQGVKIPEYQDIEVA